MTDKDDNKNHPEECDRPTYEECYRKVLQLDQLAVTYRKVLQALLDRHNGGGEIKEPGDTPCDFVPFRSCSVMLTILSPRDIEEIETALEAR